MAVEKLNDVMSAAQNYEGKRFKGVVVDNVDPLNQGRVKVYVPGLFEDGELPWVGTIKASPFGYGTNFGVYGAPALGSVIELTLQEGSANHPISAGFLADTTTTRDAEFNKPNVWGYKDPRGNKLVVDQDEETSTFTHQSGTKVTFDGSGNYTVEGGGIGTLKFPNIVLDGDVDVTGNVNIQGTLDVHMLARLLAGFAASARSGGSASTIAGDVDHTDGTFRSNGVTIHLHIHPTPQGNSGKPIEGT